MSLPGEGQVDILLDRQPASYNWPANQLCEKMSTCQTLGWSHSWWWEDWGTNHIGAQSRIPAIPLVPFVVVTYLTKARQVTQMSSAALDIPLALLSGAVCSFVLMWPNHIFLHQMYRNAIRNIFPPGQFTHILPPSILCFTTPRYYFLGTTVIITNQKCYGKKSDQISTWPKA